MEKSDIYAKKFLENLGYQVDKISESNNEEADFLVQIKDCEDIAIIEAKLKTDDKKEFQKREEKLSKGEVYILEAELGIDNNISKISSKAKKQLLSSGEKYKHDYKILLLIADGINPNIKFEQMIDTIYGRTRIFKAKENTTIDCYYYRDSIFYKRKEIDAIIVISNSNISDPYATLCLNNYSTNYEKIKKSCFIQYFRLNKAVIDPIEAEKNKQIFIPDKNAPRNINSLEKMLPSTFNPLLYHLQQKYSTGILHPIDWKTPVLEIIKE